MEAQLNRPSNTLLASHQPKLCRTARLLILMVSISCIAVSNSAVGNEPSLAEVNQLLTAGKLQQAVESLRAIDDAIRSGTRTDNVDLTFPLAIAARSLEQNKELEAAADLFQRSLQAIHRPAAKNLKIEKITMIRLAAGSSLARAGKHQEALDALEPVFQAESKADESQRKLATQLCLYVGSEALSTSKPGHADRAYSLAVLHGSEAVRPTAMLGAGWAVAMERTEPAAAAKKLAEFITAYPDHADAPRAAALQVTCLRQAKLTEQANTVLADLLDRWPESIAAGQIISQSASADEVSAGVEKWILARATKSDLSGFSPQMTGIGLLAAARTDSEAAWNTFAGHLAATDQVGGATSDTLQNLASQKLNAYAQRLAASLIAPKSDDQVSAGSREAACRWAGRNELWTMLALASESSDPLRQESNRTVAVERLFAESLMQTGRAEEAQEWWDHLVDQRNVTDFPTLLRCAETATSLSNVGAASERVESARAAAGEDGARIALVDMLSADLDIRRLEFDRARSTLENVVQSSQSIATLRGRAQWMIGETYLLQNKFVDAIETYRRVEGIDPKGPWVAVALVQAGKSFEQLGRTREAAVCYSNLLSRFGDSQHASVARRRLAEIAPSSETTSPNETIRR